MKFSSTIDHPSLEPRNIEHTVTAHLPIPPSEGSHSGPRTVQRHQHEVYAALQDPQVRKVTLLMGSQCGKTTMLFDAIVDHMMHGEGNVGWVLQSEKAITDQIADKYNPILCASSSYVQSKIRPINKHHWLSPDTGIHTYDGKHCSINSALAPGNLRSLTQPFIVVDELDLMGKGPDGTVMDAIKRAQLATAQPKIVYSSTPTGSTKTQIVPIYNESDMTEYQCPCFRCGVFWYPTWAHFDIDGKRLVCPDETCTYPNEEAWVKQNSEWVITNPTPQDQGHRGFHMNSLLSPLMTWERVVEYWLDPETTEAGFMRQLMAEPWDEVKIETPHWSVFDNAECPADEVPPGVLDPSPKVSVGVDLNDKHLDYLVIFHYDAGRIVHFVHRGAIAMTTDLTCFHQLLQEILPWSRGSELPLVGIDGGYETALVARAATEVFGGNGWWYASSRRSRFMVVRGNTQESFEGRATVTGRRNLGVPHRYIHFLAVDALKRQFYEHDIGSIMADRETTLYIAPTIREGHRREFVAEHLEVDDGRSSGMRWVQNRGKPNHGLDCAIYGMAAPDVWRDQGGRW